MFAAAARDRSATALEPIFIFNPHRIELLKPRASSHAFCRIRLVTEASD
jgi:hypothetical protein